MTCAPFLFIFYFIFFGEKHGVEGTHDLLNFILLPTLNLENDLVHLTLPFLPYTKTLF